MDLFKKILGIMIILGITYTSSAAGSVVPNDSTENLVSKFDQISYRWDLIAESLEQYEELGTFCNQPSYWNEVLNVMEQIHHYDSLVYDRLKVLSAHKNNHEIKKTVRQIEELESEYGIKEFSNFLTKECKERKKIERSREDLKTNIGQESYGGQQQLIECTLRQYIHHVTYLVDHVRKHIHHLDIDKG